MVQGEKRVNKNLYTDSFEAEVWSRKVLYCVLLLIAVLSVGCSNPQPQLNIEIQEQKTPIRCDVEIPERPQDYERGKYHLGEDLVKYHRNIENLLYFCVTGEYKDVKQSR